MSAEIHTARIPRFYRGMKIILPIIVAIGTLSQISSASELTMKHKIIVLNEYTNGRNQEAFEGTSDIERYIEAFARKWWAVMNSYAQNINNPKDVGFICSGTPAAVQGCADGYDAAKT